MFELEERLKFAERVAYRAGEIMLEYFQIGIAKEDKVDGTPVTVADRAINEMVIEAVKKEYPDDGVLGEEASYKKEGADYVWLCDPVDGTIPFTWGVPTNQFSFALVKDGVPMLGVLYDPYMKRLYHAVRGKGSFLNDRRIHVNEKRELAGNYMALPSQKHVTLFDSGGLIHEASKRGIWSCVFFCFTYEAVMTGCGQMVGNIFGYRTAHDVAAIKVIVEEAGGRVTDLLGHEQRYDQPIKGAIVSNGLIHEQLVAMVKPYLYDRLLE